MRWIFSLLIFTGILSCASPSPNDQLVTEVENLGDTLLINSQSPIDKAIAHYRVHEQEGVYSVKHTAQIKPITGQYAVIHPPFSGRIHNMTVRLGQKVQKNQLLFSMQVEEIFELQEKYQTAQKEWALAKIQFQRQKELFNHGILSQQEYEDAQQSFHIYEQAHDQILATLRLWNLNPKDIKIGQTLPITSPISGTILKTDLAAGAWIQDAESGSMIIGNPEEVWAVLLLKPKEINGLKLQQEVEVWNEVAQNWTKGTISFISSIIDPEHRHIEVFINIKNPNEDFKFGTITEVKIQQHHEKKGWRIPATAIMQKEDAFVFLKVGPHQYVPKIVKVSSLDKEHVIVTEGLEEGEEIISSGGIYLLEFL